MNTQWIPKFEVGDLVSWGVPPTMDSAKTIIEIDEDRQVYVFEDNKEQDGRFIDVYGTRVELIEYISLPSWIPRFKVGATVTWLNHHGIFVTKTIVKIHKDKELYEFHDGWKEYGLYIDTHGILSPPASPAPLTTSSSKLNLLCK